MVNGNEGDSQMTRRFRASAVAFETMADLNCFVIVLAEHADGTGERLELQRAITFDEQDRALGQDTYCLTTSDGATRYGGVRSHDLADGRLQIQLDDDAAATLGVDGFVIQLNPSVNTTSLHEAIRRVLGADA